MYKLNGTDKPSNSVKSQFIFNSGSVTDSEKVGIKFGFQNKEILKQKRHLIFNTDDEEDEQQPCQVLTKKLNMPTMCAIAESEITRKNEKCKKIEGDSSKNGKSVKKIQTSTKEASFNYNSCGNDSKKIDDEIIICKNSVDCAFEDKRKFDTNSKENYKHFSRSNSLIVDKSTTKETKDNRSSLKQINTHRRYNTEDKYQRKKYQQRLEAKRRRNSVRKAKLYQFECEGKGRRRNDSHECSRKQSEYNSQQSGERDPYYSLGTRIRLSDDRKRNAESEMNLLNNNCYNPSSKVRYSNKSNSKRRKHSIGNESQDRRMNNSMDNNTDRHIKRTFDVKRRSLNDYNKSQKLHRRCSSFNFEKNKHRISNGYEQLSDKDNRYSKDDDYRKDFKTNDSKMSWQNGHQVLCIEKVQWSCDRDEEKVNNVTRNGLMELIPDRSRFYKKRNEKHFNDYRRSPYYSNYTRKYKCRARFQRFYPKQERYAPKLRKLSRNFKKNRQFSAKHKWGKLFNHQTSAENSNDARNQPNDNEIYYDNAEKEKLQNNLDRLEIIENPQVTETEQKTSDTFPVCDAVVQTTESTISESLKESVDQDKQNCGAENEQSPLCDDTSAESVDTESTISMRYEEHVELLTSQHCYRHSPSPGPIPPVNLFRRGYPMVSEIYSSDEELSQLNIGMLTSISVKRRQGISCRLAQINNKQFFRKFQNVIYRAFKRQFPGVFFDQSTQQFCCNFRQMPDVTILSISKLINRHLSKL